MRKAIVAVLFCLSLGISSRAASSNCDDATLKIKGIGDFADMALHSRILGTAHIGKKSSRPDLFIIQDTYYPGLARYSFVKYKDSVPVFELKEYLDFPKGVGPTSVLKQYKDKVYLFWTHKKDLKYAVLDGSEFKEEGKLALPELPYGMVTFDVDFAKDGSMHIYFVANTVKMKSTRPMWRTAEYRPYDATGIWMAGYDYAGIFHFSYPSLDSGKPSQIDAITKEREVLHGLRFISIQTIDKVKGILGSTPNGGFLFFPLNSGFPTTSIRITDMKGNAMRNPVIGPDVVSYPAEKGKNHDIISFGEGGAFHMRYTGKRAENGGYMFTDMVPLKEKDPVVYGGTLITPTVVDWDKDGVLDVVCGNSAGYVLFFKNKGTNKKLKLQPGEYIKAAGQRIFIQPGYGEDIQGINEARWGYVGANVYDWNGDGFLDILTNDSRSKHSIFLGGPEGLEAEHPIYCSDLPLRGTWRCRPGVGTLAGKTVYVTLDDDDDFHLYFREDDYNLLDGGKLKLSDGRNIKANWLEAGGKGRVRFEVTDWDNDGIKDLLIATNKHNQIPADDPAGLPWTHPKSMQGSTILFMRNVGTEAEPKYEFPRQLKYKGNIIRLGHHGCGASVGKVGEITDGLPNIIAGDERGHLYLFERKNLTW